MLSWIKDYWNGEAAERKQNEDISRHLENSQGHLEFLDSLMQAEQEEVDKLELELEKVKGKFQAARSKAEKSKWQNQFIELRQLQQEHMNQVTAYRNQKAAVRSNSTSVQTQLSVKRTKEIMSKGNAIALGNRAVLDGMEDTMMEKKEVDRDTQRLQKRMAAQFGGQGQLSEADILSELMDEDVEGLEESQGSHAVPAMPGLQPVPAHPVGSTATASANGGRQPGGIQLATKTQEAALREK